MPHVPYLTECSRLQLPLSFQYTVSGPRPPSHPLPPESHLPRLFETPLQVCLLLLHFALPFLHLLQLDLVLLQLFQLCLVFCPFQPQGLQLLLQVPYLGLQPLLLLQRDPLFCA